MNEYHERCIFYIPNQRNTTNQEQPECRCAVDEGGCAGLCLPFPPSGGTYFQSRRSQPGYRRNATGPKQRLIIPIHQFVIHFSQGTTIHVGGYCLLLILCENFSIFSSLRCKIVRALY